MNVQVINGTVGLPDKTYPTLIRRYHAGDLLDVDTDTAERLLASGSVVLVETPEETMPPESVEDAPADVVAPPSKKPPSKKSTSKKSTSKKSTSKKTEAAAEEIPEEDPPELTASAVV